METKNIKNEEIKHHNLFDSLYDTMCQQVGKDRADYDIHLVFAKTIVDAGMGKLLIPLKFEDYQIQKKWQDFQNDTNGMKYEEKFKIFKYSGLYDEIGLFPPSYILKNHAGYWQQHEKLKIPLNFNNDGIHASRILKENPVDEQYLPLIANHVHMLNADYNRLYVVALENSQDSIARLIQADKLAEGGKSLPVYQEMEGIPVSEDFRFLEASKMIREGNDLIAVFRKNQEFPQASNLSGLLAYKENDNHIWQITDCRVFNNDVNPMISESLIKTMCDKLDRMAEQENMLIVSNMIGMDNRYFPSMGAHLNVADMESLSIKNLISTIFENWDNPSFDQYAIAETFFETLKDCAKDIFLDQIHQRWIHRQNNPSPISPSSFTQQEFPIFQDKMQQLEYWIEQWENNREFKDAIPFIQQETFREMAERIMEIKCYKGAFNDITNKIQELKNEKKMEYITHPSLPKII